MNGIDRLSGGGSAFLPLVGGTMQILPAGLISAEATQSIGATLADFVALLRDQTS